MESNKNIYIDTNRVKSLISKLAYFSEAGTEEGERDSAKNKLNEICMKYGIIYDGSTFLESTAKSFKYSNNESKMILSHCIWDVVNNAEITGDSRRKDLFVVMTSSQQIEVNERYCFYWKKYKKEIKLFTTNFILKNKIGLEINQPIKQNKYLKNNLN